MADKLSPEMRAYVRLQREQMKLQRENMRAVLAAERIRARRDIGMSIAQASATNPLWSQAAIAIAGAGLATLGGLGDRALRAFAPERAKGVIFQPGRTFGQSPLETVGEGMMAFAGARAATQGIADVIGAIRGTPQANSIAFDIPDSEGAVMLASQPAGAPFPSVPRRPSRRA